MSIRLKVAKTAEELDDVFRLRHEVYIQERDKFSSSSMDYNRVVNHFDTLPDVANIVAYSGSKAIATMRVNKDSQIGLPAEDYFDFSDIRSRLKKYYQDSKGQEPNIV